MFHSDHSNIQRSPVIGLAAFLVVVLVVSHSMAQSVERTFDGPSVPPSVTKLFAELAPKLDELANDSDQLIELAKRFESEFDSETMPEGIRMLISIAHGSQMGPMDGWFGPGRHAYDFNWLRNRYQAKAEMVVEKSEFRGDDRSFQTLDRNRNGKIEAGDLDWSDNNPYLREAAIVMRVFRRIDSSGDASVSKEEWDAFYQAMSEDSQIRSEGWRNAFLGGPGGFLPGDQPTQERLIHGLFGGEVGSLGEGPKIGQPAPDFFLKTHDGKQSIRLSDRTGDKPVVLVFGNFTCGPFRRNFPEIDDLAKKWKDQASFIGIYVREAHPTDGWMMESNTRMGVQFAQPKTYEERTKIAQQCNTKLKYSMPLLVDEIDDPVGTAYSGMPARLYVIDRKGMITYQSGRGPFGFKGGEMEQALVMTLLADQ